MVYRRSPCSSSSSSNECSYPNSSARLANVVLTSVSRSGQRARRSLRRRELADLLTVGASSPVTRSATCTAASTCSSSTTRYTSALRSLNTPCHAGERGDGVDVASHALERRGPGARCARSAASAGTVVGEWDRPRTTHARGFSARLRMVFEKNWFDSATCSSSTMCTRERCVTLGVPSADAVAISAGIDPLEARRDVGQTGSRQSRHSRRPARRRLVEHARRRSTPTRLPGGPHPLRSAASSVPSTSLTAAKNASTYRRHWHRAARRYRLSAPRATHP